MSENEKKSKDMIVWADRAMYTAVPTSEGTEPVVPTVSLLAAQADPLGAMAAASLMYQGQPIRDTRDVTDEQRRWFLNDIKKTRLDSPFEFIDLHFIVEGVTRAFTHQMVRQRTGAVYVQESQRFAVKENGKHEVSMPPSLNGTLSLDELIAATQERYAELGLNPESVDPETVAQEAGGAQGQRLKWDEATAQITRAYMDLVNGGMPAEDARGLLPTNITTRIHYKTNVRALIGHAGNRLCTQAQFEWRIVWAGMIQAMQKYGREQTYEVRMRWEDAHALSAEENVDWRRDDYSQRLTPDEVVTVIRSSSWQFDEISTLFRPICYATGKCEFMSDMDRHCNIRERVQAFHDKGVKSDQWEAGRVDLGIPAIHPAEWLADPASARIRAEAK